MADTEQGANNSTYTGVTFSANAREFDFSSYMEDQRLLAAAREDNEEMLLEIFEQGGFDINFQDGYVSSSP